MSIRDIFSGLIEIVYPKRCLICHTRIGQGGGDTPVCQGCWDKIVKNAPPFCLRCNRHLEAGFTQAGLCALCVKNEYYFDRAFCACGYEGVLKGLIHEFKYKGKEYLGAPLAKLMAEHSKQCGLAMETIDLLIPVPLHTAKLREREFNQAEILARHIGTMFKKPVAKNILTRNRATRTQTGLATQERLANVKDSFTVRKEAALTGKSILLIDDVLTTGATCSEAARALKNAGAKQVLVLALAN